jgi:hypothetical protein
MWKSITTQLLIYVFVGFCDFSQLATPEAKRHIIPASGESACVGHFRRALISAQVVI